jgi:hypothetical protein
MVRAGKRKSSPPFRLLHSPRTPHASPRYPSLDIDLLPSPARSAGSEIHCVGVENLTSGNTARTVTVAPTPADRRPSKWRTR